jgi:selenide,water dikinase
VGHENNDDAAVFRIDGSRVLVQTVDFFTPVIDDPHLFGAIAAANSISDVYAMGAEPILGLAVAGFPTEKLPLEVLEQIFAGGATKAREAGFPIAGGHTIIDDVPKYGLVVTGICAADAVVLNSTARPGDLLYLTKPIGNGVAVAAYRAGTKRARWGIGRKHLPAFDDAVVWMQMLNRDAARAMVAARATACTDVTGYGLIGHLREMCSGARAGARISAAAIPVIEGVRDLLAKGYVPAGTRRNESAFRASVELRASGADLTLCCDAQTSGGLLIAVAPEHAPRLEKEAAATGTLCARIGEMTGRTGTIELIA